MDIPTPQELETLLGRKASPDELLESVRQKPIVNTFREQAAIILEMVHLVPAPGKEEYFRYFKSGDKAIYWKSSQNNIDVEIIGVVWDKGHNPRVLCGIILPP